MLRPRLLLFIGSIAALTAACGRTQGAPSPEGEPGGPGGRALRVRVAPVEAQDVVYRIRALGSLEAEDLVQVTAEVDGAASSVRFNEGDRVTPQTVLLAIDPERHRLEAERSRASHRKAEADRERAEADLRRREALADSQLVAAEELNRSRTETDRLRAEVEAAKAALDIAEQNLQRSQVRAPRGGVINTKAVNTGQFVRVGTVLAVIVDVSRLRLRFKVSEGESLRVKESQEVGFHVAALGEQEFKAKVYHVAETADPNTRQVEVLAWVANPGMLKPGFFAEVGLSAESKQDTTVVPESAVQASERGFIAYVVEDGKARARAIQIGLRTESGLVEVLSGLKRGETLVIEGSDRLADGVAVEWDEGPQAGRPAAEGKGPGERQRGPR